MKAIVFLTSLKYLHYITCTKTDHGLTGVAQLAGPRPTK